MVILFRHFNSSHRCTRFNSSNHNQMTWPASLACPHSRCCMYTASSCTTLFLTIPTHLLQDRGNVVPRVCHKKKNHEDRKGNKIGERERERKIITMFNLYRKKKKRSKRSNEISFKNITINKSIILPLTYIQNLGASFIHRQSIKFDKSCTV